MFLAMQQANQINLAPLETHCPQPPPLTRQFSTRPAMPFVSALSLSFEDVSTPGPSIETQSESHYEELNQLVRMLSARSDPQSSEANLSWPEQDDMEGNVDESSAYEDTQDVSDSQDTIWELSSRLSLSALPLFDSETVTEVVEGTLHS